MIRTIIGGAMALVVAAVSAPTAPLAAQTDIKARAASCVLDYRRTLLSEKAPALIADLAATDYQSRYKALLLRGIILDRLEFLTIPDFEFKPEFEKELEAAARGEIGALPFGILPTEGLFADKVHTDLDSGNPDDEDRAIAALAKCDQEFGFRITSRAPPTDIECAVRYVVGAALSPQDKAGAMERAHLSAVAHQQANPSDTPDAIRERIDIEVKARVQPFEMLATEDYMISKAWRDAEDYPDAEGTRAALERQHKEWQVRRKTAGAKAAAGIAACEAKYGRTPPPQQPNAQGR